MNLTAAGLHLAFAERRSWQDQYRLLLELAAKAAAAPLPEWPADSRLSGCESAAWLHLAGSLHLHCQVASPSRIVRGLLLVLCAPVQGASVEEIAAFDFDGYLQTLGLRSHLSESRGNGLRQAIERLRAWDGGATP